MPDPTLGVLSTADAIETLIVPRAVDLSEMHVHLAFWRPATFVPECIPWIKGHFEEPIRVQDDRHLRPDQPGSGATPLASGLGCSQAEAGGQAASWSRWHECSGKGRSRAKA